MRFGIEISKQFIVRKTQRATSTRSSDDLFQMKISRLATGFHESTLLAVWLEISESKLLLGKFIRSILFNFKTFI